MKNQHEKYLSAFYRQKKTDYPEKLCRHLVDRFNLQSNMKLLDVGSGNEEYINEFSKIGLNAWGIDIMPHENNRVKVCDLNKDAIPFPEKHFDVVFTKSCLEHLKPVEHPLSEMKRVLKKNGIVIVMVPDWTSCMKWYYDGYDHVSPMTRRGLRDLMRYVGFQNVKCEYFYQLPFVWKRKYLEFIPKVISIIPDRFKWKDEDNHRILVRFSKEKMLLAWGLK